MAISRNAGVAAAAAIIITLAAILYISWNPGSENLMAEKYGAQVQYQKGKVLKFPDLTIEDIGESTSEGGGGGGISINFRVSAKGETDQVSCGLGEKCQFELGGNAFELELKVPVDMGKQEDYILVLTKTGKASGIPIPRLR